MTPKVEDYRVSGLCYYRSTSACNDLGLILLLLGSGLAADRNTIIQDPAISSAFKQRYLALTDSWVREIAFTPAETAAMESGKQWEALMMKGPDDPLGRKILAAGEPSFEALASYYPGKILDRTVLGTYSDPRQPMGDYPDEFSIYWNGAIACNLIKGQLSDRYGATGVAPLAHNTVVLFRVGSAGEQFGRVRSRYSSIGYEKGYLPIVTATGDRTRRMASAIGEPALADRHERREWQVGYRLCAVRNDKRCRRRAHGSPAVGYYPERRHYDEERRR